MASIAGTSSRVPLQAPLTFATKRQANQSAVQRVCASRSPGSRRWTSSTTPSKFSAGGMRESPEQRFQPGSFQTSTETVLGMINRITANLKMSKANKLAAKRADPDMPLSMRGSRTHTLLGHEIFPTPRDTQGLLMTPPPPKHAVSADSNPDRISKERARDFLPSFTPSRTGESLFFASPQLAKPRRAQALSKLNSVSLAGSDLRSFNHPESVMPKYPNWGHDHAPLAKEFLSDLQEPAEPKKSPATTLEASSALDNWDQLIKDMQSPSPKDGPRTIASSVSASRFPEVAPDHCVPDLSHLQAQLANLTSLRSSVGPLQGPELSRDEAVALRVQLRNSARSRVHLRHFLDVLFRHLAHPPPGVVTQCLQAARELGDAHLAYAVVAQLRAGGMVGALRALDGAAFHELLRVAAEVERSVPRVQCVVRDMARLGIRPDGQSVRLLDQLLLAKSAKAGVAEAEVALSHNCLPLRPSHAEADDLWKTLMDVNWTHYFKSRLRPRAARLTENTGASTLSNTSLSDLIQHSFNASDFSSTSSSL